MSAADIWIYLDGPEPAEIRLLLDAIRELPPATPQEKEDLTRSFFERLDAVYGRHWESGGGDGGGDAGGDRRADAEAAEPQSARAESARRAAEAGATVRSPLTGDPGEAAAPVAVGGARAVIEVQGTAEEAASEAAPEGPKSTAMALDLPPEVRAMLRPLPFRPVVPGEPLPWEVAGKTMALPVYGRAPGMTAPLGDDAIAKAVASVKVLPFEASKPAEESFPRLTVEQYASLRAELAVKPEMWAEIMQRYQVPNEAVWGALVEHWEKGLAARPEERAAFEEALGRFVAYLRGMRG